MKQGSLFSGIGGFDIASEWMGWENMFHAEIEEFNRKILKYYWPDAKAIIDVRTADFSYWKGKIDILTGGFPCQPFSQAGKRLGKKDERHLWPFMLDAVRAIQPNWIVGENVHGIVNWNRGMVFEEVHTDLEAEGYEVFAFVLPASAYGAPHRRDRVWFIAHRTDAEFKDVQRWEFPTYQPFDSTNANSAANGSPGQSGKAEINRSKDNNQQESRGEPPQLNNGCCDVLRDAANANRERFRGEINRERKTELFNENLSQYDWENFPTQSPICSGNDGFSSKLDGITISKHRRESTKGYGNAIVPQIAFHLFQIIQQIEQQ